MLFPKTITGRRCKTAISEPDLLRSCARRSRPMVCSSLLILFCFQVMPKVSAQTITGSAPVPRLFCKFGQSAFPPMFWCSGAVSTNFSGRQAANPQTLYQRARRRSLLSACSCVVTAFRFSRRPLMTLGGWMLCLGSRMMLSERSCTKPDWTASRCFLFCFPLPLKD